ncbi:MAG: hypothetical protein DBY05_13105, partial [Clostridiales bacterium]
SFVRRRFAFAKRSRFRQTLMLFRPTAFRFCKTLTVSPNAYALSSDGVSLLPNARVFAQPTFQSNVYA